MKTRNEYDHMAVQVMRTRSLHVGQWTGARAFFHKVLDSAVYSVFMGLIIVANAIIVIHETDQKAAGEELPSYMTVASYVFLFIYAIEIAVRCHIYRWRFFQSAWNILDFVVVIADCFTEFLKLWAGAEDDLPSLAILRIFRLARLVRLVAMLSVFQELQTMLLGFGSALKGVVWASMMIGVVVTVCSIIAVEFIHPLNVEVARSGVYDHQNCKRCGRAFETVLESNLTFIQQIIAGDSWGRITIPIMEAYPASGVFFLLVFGFIDLGVLNLILTVIVNAAEAARESNHDMQLRIKAHKAEVLKKQLQELVGQLDVDQDGRISLEEFQTGVDDNEDLRKTMALLDFQRQDAEIIYFLMDEDQSGEVDYNEFISAMISWKNESLNTKMLFLKASIHDIYRDLKNENRILNEQVIGKIIGAKEVKQSLTEAISESAVQTSLQPEGLKAEFESLTQKLDQRWEQLQIEQAKKFKMLDQVFNESFTQPPSQRLWSGTAASYRSQEERGSSHTRSAQSSLLSLPPSCTNCEVADNTKTVVASGPYTPSTSTPSRRPEPGEKLGRFTEN